MDIFISYRRNGGEAWAYLIREKLANKGVSVFLDKHNMHNGDFSKSLQNNIRNANNFLLILSPNIFEKRNPDEVDWVREEIIFATREKKNIICVMVNGYDASVDLSNEAPEIARLMTWDALMYQDANKNLAEASIKSIIDRMVDDENNKFILNQRSKSNNWYGDHEITDEDMLWIKTFTEVCKNSDARILEKMAKETPIKNKENINLMCLDLYDVDSYLSKYSVDNKKNDFYQGTLNVFGFCHGTEVAKANETFGDYHFIECLDEKGYEEGFRKLLRDNNLKGFDVIDATLILKDVKKPEIVMRMLTKYLSPTGGIIYIKELDDDYVDAYPDENGYIKELINILALDEGAGNRHLGKQIYTFLKRVGAEKVYISDEIVSTANFKNEKRKKLCDAYFSYLKPEIKSLVKDNPDNEDYKQANNWLLEHFEKVESMFCSNEFYFRSGFISGYGVFINEEEDDE